MDDIFVKLGRLYTNHFSCPMCELKSQDYNVNMYIGIVGAEVIVYNIHLMLCVCLMLLATHQTHSMYSNPYKGQQNFLEIVLKRSV